MSSSIADQTLVGFSWEKRPLKRPRLGPPDVYPQDPKQREDELTTVHVKQGFSHMPQISDEFGSAKNCNITAAKLGAFINGTISKKIELNALPDTGRKRLQVNTKDNFWPVTVTPKSKHSADAWMKDLAGSKPLAALAKRVPIFNKKEEVFSMLVEFSVPMLRATWFLKMTASYNSAISEQKTKKRQMPDPSQEWTIALLKYMKDILLRLSDWYAGGTGIIPSSSSSSSTVGSSGSSTSTSGQTASGNPPSSASIVSTSAVVEDGSVSLKQWLYCSDLAKQMFGEGLLDRFEWLQWVIDACEKTKALDDSSWQALVPLLLSFIPDIAKSEYLARRLAHIAARRLSVLFADLDISSPLPPQPPAALMEYLQCPVHKGTVLTLVSALQVIAVDCPTALVWNSIPMRSESPTNGNPVIENTRNGVPAGSPLDLIPVPPSALPMPPRANNSIVRAQVRAAEEVIRQRSQAVEVKWACEEWQASTEASTLQKVLSALDALDRHFFDKGDVNNSIETMYAKIFSGISICKENPAETDAPIILLLCQWAVGPHRCGEHRALAVARLLELRQSEVTSYHESEADVLGIGASQNNNEQTMKSEPQGLRDEFTNPNNNESGQLNGGQDGSNCNPKDGDDESEGYCGLPIYHNLLFNYLDSDAPTLDESSPTSRSTFASLVHLFSALIRHDIFSHDTYLCTLVARGDLSTFPPATTQANSSATPIQQIQSVATPGPHSHAGPGTPASVSSVTPGTTPHHDSVTDDNRGPLFPPLPRIPDFSLGAKGEPGFPGLDAAKRQGDVDDRSSENIDDDLDRILQDITQEQQNNMNQIDSPKEENGAGSSFGSISNNPGATPRANGPMSISPTAMNPEHSKNNRHRLYVTHFPLPQDESCTHEANQRHILLYGVGRSRDEARHFVKKVFKDLGKLFSKKFCFDVSDGSRVKKQSKNEVSLENLQARFQALPYFDQHAVTSLVGSTALELMVSFAAGRGCYLPTVEHVAFLTELMELALNIHGLIEICAQMLRELHDIETQLCHRGSSIMGQYTTSMQLQLVAVMRRYHNCLLLETELTAVAWESLIKLMKRVTNASEWTSAERCSLAYIIELQSSGGFLPGKSLNDLLSPLALKLKQNLSTTIYPSSTRYEWNNQFMTQCLDNPRRKVEPSIIRQLIDNPVCRYSFVCNAVLSICNEADAERVNDLAALCAEMTAVCPQLAAEWLGVFQSLCCPSHHDTSYAEILSEVDVKHLSIHSNLATLNAMLIARQCFSLQDQIVVQAVPSLLKAWQAEKAWSDGRGPNDADIEAGARLTCHLLLSLFKTQDHLSSTTPSILRLSCDRRLLSAAHNNITLGAVLAVLKAMLVLADAAAANERRREQRTIPGIPQGELSISHILGTSDAPSDRSDVVRGEPRTLASFAINALHQMCAEPWLRQRCLQNPDELCNDDILLDRILSPKQAQRLLHMICYPEASVHDDCLDARVHIPRVLDNLDQWNLREALLTLSLQNKQLVTSPGEHQGWLDIVARAALEVFHLAEEPGQEYVPTLAAPSPAPGKSPRSGKKPQDQNVKTPPSVFGYANRSTLSPPNPEGKSRKQLNSASAWLIAPVIAKLPPSVQGRVLRHAGNVLESTLWPKNPPGPDTPPGLHAHLPFLALILTCLKGQDEQRETLLQSLLTQFTQLLQYAKEADSEGKSQVLRDALRLRLTLVGAMFDVVQRSSQTTAEWAVVLTQLVTHLVVDLNNNNDVFLTIVDMVTCLVHSTQITESGERVEETRKQNLNLIKKLKKELSDRNSPSVVPLRQLLPFSKVQVEVIVTQPTSTIVDSKGNRVQSFEFVDKKPGLQVWEKQRVSPWELIEGQRNPAPLSWSWFGAVKMDRKPLRYEEAHRLNKFHTHNMVKPFAHFLEPVPLPMEEMDMKPELHIKEELMLKPDTPMSDQSPRGTISKPPKPKAPRKKRLTKAQQQAAQAAAAAAAGAQQQVNTSMPQPPPPNIPNPVEGGQYNMPLNQIPPGSKPPPPSYGQRPGPPPQWYDTQQQQPPPPQQPFFPQHQVQGAGTRPNQSSKAALHQMLRGRNPAAPPGGTNQFQQFPQGPPAPGPAPRAQILRQQLRAAASQPGQPQMQSQNFAGAPPNQNAMFQGQPQNQGMNQNYNFNQQNINMPNQGSGGSMMTPQPPNIGQMGPRGPVGDMNFAGQPGPGVRPNQPRQGTPFIQGQPQGGMAGPMPGYPRQMTRPSQPNQMLQMSQGQQPMQNPGQMQQGQMNQMGQMQGQMGQGGMMGPNNPQRFRQMGMGMQQQQLQQQLQQQHMQQQQQQQQPGMGNMGMRGPNNMHYNQNQQPGPY